MNKRHPLSTRPLGAHTSRFAWALALHRPYLRGLIAATVLIVLRTVADLLSPLVYRLAVDSAVSRSTAVVVSSATAYGLLAVATNGLGALYSYILAVCGLNVSADIRSRVLKAAFKWPLRRWDASSTGEVQARIVADTQGLQSLLTETIPSFVRNVTLIPLAAAAVLTLDWRFALPCLALVPLYALPARFGGSWTRSAWQRVFVARERMIGTIQDALQGIRTIKALANEDAHVEGLRTYDRDFVNASVRAAVVGRVYAISVAAVSVLPVALVLGWGGVLVARGLATVGTIVAVVAYVQQLYAALGVLPGLYVETRKLGVLLDRLVEYVESEPEESGTLRPALRDRSDVVLEDVWLAYGNREALRGVSLVVPDGRTIALVGQSGSGKSSVAMLALGLYRPDRGRVIISGVDLAKCDLGWIRRHVGLITQEPFLFAGTIRENIAYSRPEATWKDIVRAARLACIDRFIERLPQGYDTLCGERSPVVRRPAPADCYCPGSTPRPASTDSGRGHLCT